jgi:hypothetical protein
MYTYDLNNSHEERHIFWVRGVIKAGVDTPLVAPAHSDSTDSILHLVIRYFRHEVL